jgi:hypothetical protein
MRSGAGKKRKKGRIRGEEKKRKEEGNGNEGRGWEKATKYHARIAC